MKLASIIPWQEIEQKYSELFVADNGAPAKPVRMALGSLIIKEKCGYSDRETVDQITENPYLQYFIGLKEFQEEPPFTVSLMVLFRKRLGVETMKQINELIASAQSEKDDENDNSNNNPGNTQGKTTNGKTKKPNKVNDAGQTLKGKLILDATCALADIRYPTDLSLLNEGREKLETIVDTLYEPLRGEISKPRTYRQRARKDYLFVAKCRKNSAKKLRKAVGKQLVMWREIFISLTIS